MMGIEDKLNLVMAIHGYKSLKDKGPFAAQMLQR
jgi:hypothetical protein